MYAALRPFIRIWHKIAPSIPVYKNVEGVRMYMDLRDNIHYVVLLRDRLSKLEPRVFAVMDCVGGPIWDIGCNIGVFSVRAARMGHKVTSFDLSPKAVRYLRRTAAYNKLQITAIDRPVTVVPTAYPPPTTSHTENKLNRKCGANGANTSTSMTYLEAAAEFGIPKLLKMDIEGGETEFLQDEGFHRWIRENRVAWLLESHRYIPGEMLSIELPRLQVDPYHFLYHADREVLAAVSERLASMGHS